MDSAGNHANLHDFYWRIMNFVQMHKRLKLSVLGLMFRLFCFRSSVLRQIILLPILGVVINTSILAQDSGNAQMDQVRQATEDAYADSKIPQPDMATWYTGASAEWLTDELRTNFFPTSTRSSGLEGDPPAVEIFEDQTLLGFMFLTVDAVPSLGFSSMPFQIAVGLALDGNLVGATVLDHSEPIIDILLLDGLANFGNQYTGVDIRRPWRVSLTKISYISGQSDESTGASGTLDGISAATISAVLFNEAILTSARLVARAHGLRLNDQPAVDMTFFQENEWSSLVEDGSVAHLKISAEEAAAQGIDLSVHEEVGESLRLIQEQVAPRYRREQRHQEAEGSPEEKSFIDLYVAPVTPPSIGRNIMGDQSYNLFISGRAAEDLVLLMMSKGTYELHNMHDRITGPFERFQLIQGQKTFELSKDWFRYFGFLHGKDKPIFSEIGLLWLPASEGVDPLEPWRLEIPFTAEDGTTSVFSLPYQLPVQYVLEPTGLDVMASDNEPLWVRAWETQAVNIAILLIALTSLTAILILMEPLTRRPKLYFWLRNGFMLFTLVWLGWIAGAQVTIINIITWIQAAIGPFNADVILSDPLIIVLMAYVLVTFLIWGRGIFCGWLCPFGAMQELLAKVAQAIRLPQLQLSSRTHKFLWPIKYVVLAVLIGLSFYSMTAASIASEVEPFKTAISLKFARDWPYVIYAVTLLCAGLVVERFFCRFFCPLGAAMAIGGKLRIFSSLKRRAECGSPCHLCEKKCPISAIEPTGKINMNECFYCLDCQVVYYDELTCPPLVTAGRRAKDIFSELPAGVTGAPTPAGAKLK